MATELLDRPETVANEDSQVLVTLTVADQLCGIPVLAVRDILGEQTITRASRIFTRSDSRVALIDKGRLSVPKLRGERILYHIFLP